MAYTKVGWKDGAEGSTPVNSANLNKMDNQIKSNADLLGDTPITSVGESVTDAIINLDSSLDETKDEIEENLTAEDDVKFIFGKLNGKYGHYLSSSRGADSFRPFQNASLIGTYNAAATINVASLKAKTVNEFVVSAQATNDSITYGWSSSASGAPVQATGYYSAPKLTVSATNDDGTIRTLSFTPASFAGAAWAAVTPYKALTSKIYYIGEL